jgi:hypothetical protein
MLAMSISVEQNMFVVAGHFLSYVVDEHGQHPVSTVDDGTCILKHTDS